MRRTRGLRRRPCRGSCWPLAKRRPCEDGVASLPPVGGDGRGPAAGVPRLEPKPTPDLARPRPRTPPRANDLAVRTWRIPGHPPQPRPRLASPKRPARPRRRVAWSRSPDRSGPTASTDCECDPSRSRPRQTGDTIAGTGRTSSNRVRCTTRQFGRCSCNRPIARGSAALNSRRGPPSPKITSRPDLSADSWASTAVASSAEVRLDRATGIPVTRTGQFATNCWRVSANPRQITWAFVANRRVARLTVTCCSRAASGKPSPAAARPTASPIAPPKLTTTAGRARCSSRRSSPQPVQGSRQARDARLSGAKPKATYS